MTWNLPFGFWIKGPTDAPRRLVDGAAALAAYAACDPRAGVDSEAYLAAFTYGADFRRRLEETGSVRGFEGECWAPFVTFDIDRAGDLDAALADTRRLVGTILERYPALDETALLCFFSGSKGFNVALPTFWQPAPSATFHRATRHFAEELARRAGVVIDPAVYVKTQPLRAPNSRHPKTGLHKRRLAVEELNGLCVEGIRRLAARPEPFEPPALAAPCEQAAADWRAAVEAAGREAESAAARRQFAPTRGPRLNQLTRQFLRDGAAEGDRHRLLFSAAANLAEFGCPLALAFELLTEPALDSGLAPSDVRRQIECGLRRAGPLTPAPSLAPGPKGDDAGTLRKRLAVLWAAPPPAVGDAAEPEGVRADPARLEFPFGANVTGPYDPEGGRR
jgi:hypothetical protein